MSSNVFLLDVARGQYLPFNNSLKDAYQLDVTTPSNKTHGIDKIPARVI